MDINTDYWYKNRWEYQNVPGLSAIVDITANDEDAQSDIEEAVAAMQAQQQVQQAQQGQEAPPWADLMEELNITPQGSKEADMTAIAQAISQRSAEAVTEAEKAAVQTLVSEFAQYNDSGFSVSLTDNDGELTANANTDTGDFSGRNQLADLNKLFLVKQFANAQ